MTNLGGELEVEGRVISVRPREAGDFAVLVGLPPSTYWFTAATPPRLGQFVVATGYLAAEHPVAGGGYTRVMERTRFRVAREPYARRVVNEVWYRRAEAAVRRPLLPYQVEGAGWIASHLADRRGIVLSDDPGCGKSAQAIAGVLAVETGALLPCLVVCPASVRCNWVAEIGAVSRVPRQVELVGTRGGIGPLTQFAVVHYDVLAALEASLANFGFRSLILDEAHAVKNKGAQGRHRAAVATRLAARIRRTVLLTGTPVPNRPSELWRLLHIADPTAWPSLRDFTRRYCSASPDDRRAVRTSTGVLSHVEEFHAMVAPYVLRRRKEEVTDLPPIRRRIMTVDMAPEDAAAYESARENVVAWLASLGVQRAAKALKAGETLLKLGILRRIAALSKLRAALPVYLRTWLRRVGRPLVIFGYHKRVVAGAARVAAEAGARVATLGVSVAPDRRQDVVDAFTLGKHDVLVCSLLVAGVGLNLQAASDAVFLERLWVPTLMEQAEARCHRLGARREVTCTYFDARGTIDEYIATVLAAKQTIIDHAVGDAELERDIVYEIVGKLTAPQAGRGRPA